MAPADEGIDCDYVKRGWVWAAGEKDADKPLAAQRMGEGDGVYGLDQDLC